MKKLADVTIFGEQLGLYETLRPGYAGGVFLELRDDFEPWATVTVNLPEVPLEPDEFTVKMWSENEAIRQPLLATGLFEDTGKRVPSGFVSAEVWRRLV